MKTPVEMKKEKYTIQVNYSEDAIEKKMMKFITRQIRCRAARDIKKGDEIRLEYKHPYPVEFALIEEAMKIAKINKDVKVFELTKEYLDAVRLKIKPVQEKFINHFYKFFKNLFKK